VLGSTGVGDPEEPAMAEHDTLDRCSSKIEVRSFSTSMKLGSSDGESLVPDVENAALAPSLGRSSRRG